MSEVWHRKGTSPAEQFGESAPDFVRFDDGYWMLDSGYWILVPDPLSPILDYSFES